MDRQSRFTIVTRVKTKTDDHVHTANHVHAKIKQRMTELDAQRRQSITFDNITERPPQKLPEMGRVTLTEGLW